MTDLRGLVGPMLVAGAAAVLGYMTARLRGARPARPATLAGTPLPVPATPVPADPFGPAPLEATLQALIQAIDARNPAAGGHVRRVRAAAMELGRASGLDAEALATLRLAALLHDVGTLMIPEQVLSKPGRLNDIEFEKVKAHPVTGVAMLARAGLPPAVLEIIRHHHERWDGGGYPDRLKGMEIPLGARILAVADSFESLVSDRAHRGSLGPVEAAELITTWAGVQFDREIVNVLRSEVAAVHGAVMAAGHDPEPPLDIARLTAPSVGVEGPSGDAGGFGTLLHQGIAGEMVRRPSGAELPRPAVADGTSRDASAAQREVYALYEIAHTLCASLHLTDVLDLVVSKIAMLVPFRTCVVFLTSAPKTLQARFVSGANAASLRGRMLPFGDGITGWAAEHRTSSFSGNAELDLFGIEIDPAAYSTVAAFPLVHGEEVLGVITLYFPANSPCVDDHVRVMEILARLASGAIHEGRLGLEQGESGLTDAVTHLPNERYLRQAFDKEVVRSQQSGQALSVVEMDLEEFRTLNERIGAEAGDRFLLEVGRVLRSHLRERDVLVRMEEDGFAALLPGTGFAAAALLTERLQKAVDGFALRLEDGTVARAGLSIGIAIYPLDGEGYDDLMQRASLNRVRNRQARRAARAASPNVVPFRPVPA